MAVYLDYAATSYPKPECVYNNMLSFMKDNGASPGRGNYARAMAADRLVYQARKALCRLLGAKRPGQIVFTANATEAINLALKGFLREGDKVLTTAYEHNAMWRPLKSLERDRGIRIETVPAGGDGWFDLDRFRQQVRDGVRLVAVAHGSNVLGCITPLEEIAAIAREQGAAVLVDAAQTGGVYPIDLQRAPVDFLAFTGHKGLLGPTGTGGLYIAGDGADLHTFKEGGTGSQSSSPYQPDDLPDRFEAGTMNIAGIAGLHAAVEFLLERGIDAVRQHEIALMDRLYTGLLAIPGITCHGPRDARQRLGLLSFQVEGQDPTKVALRLDQEFGIMVRAGLHCAPQAHRLLGTETIGTVRAGAGYFTTAEDIDQLICAAAQIAK